MLPVHMFSGDANPRRERDIPIVTACDLAYIRLRSPDLHQARAFLDDFGFTFADRTEHALYMRGSGTAHHIHITEEGDPGVVGFAFNVESEEELARASRIDGATCIEVIDEPGGGKRVRVCEPNGFVVELVHGIETVTEIPVESLIYNSGSEPLRRPGRLQRLAPSPSRIKRIGHVVLASPDPRRTTRWFHDNLGLIASDDIYVETPDNVIATFSRIDRGDEYVDHHAFFCFQAAKAGLNHVSFEVPDIDAVIADHEHLKRLGKYEHMWGIGRHLLGSQVFDYWLDPWGRIHEHWADSDRLTRRDLSNLISAEEGFVAQWGKHPPQSFLAHASR